MRYWALLRNIADLHVGMVNKDAFEKEIQTLLNEPAK